MPRKHPPPIELIRSLADGKWHSGETLAGVLGVSRTAVWKRLRELETLGLELHKLTGRGYRLARPLELLDKDAIARAIAPARKARLDGMEVLALTDSTNRVLMENRLERALCFAEYQSAGRGRRGRSWVSPFGANLYFSAAWSFSSAPAALAGLSLAVGVGLARVLRELGIAELGLKWPNDLYWREKKLGGILIEHAGEAGGPWRVVAGVGINFAMSEQQAKSVDQPWTSLAEACAAPRLTMPGRNHLAGQCADALLAVLERFGAEGLEPFRKTWSEFDIAHNRVVRIEDGGRWREGRACGIDTDGALLLQIGSNQQRFVSGEVSLRLE
ncbi:MAG: bifunctional biotin--[acetyl-CoA-carboxylase] ligase/biotin operon repressor BirA [Nevskiales bacterium]